MRLSPVETQVFDAIRDLEVIDAHEHLVPETHRVELRVDFSILFSHYTSADFISAGMQPEIYQRMINEETMPVEEKWAAFREFYPMIRLGSYARPARIWLQDVPQRLAQSVLEHHCLAGADGENAGRVRRPRAAQ